MKKRGAGRDKPREKKHFRENIEAIAMAIAVALLFKTFVLEVSKIPSGSMQPTLMGSPAAGVNDRVLVDKLSYRFRDPKRWEIIVFRHPLERSRVMVKRLVGMPGEAIKVEHGDLWHRPQGAAEWTVLRRPEALMADLWKPLDLRDPETSSWEAVRGDGWRAFGRTIQARGDGRARFRSGDRSIVDGYADGYIDSLRATVTQEALRRGVRPGRHPVGDLRLEGQVEVAPEASQVLLELTEGLRTYEFRIPGPAANPGERTEVRIRDSAAYGAGQGGARREERIEAGPAIRLMPDEAHRFVAQNLDDRLRLEIDGEVLIEVDVEAAKDQTSTASVILRGGSAEFTDLQVSRDIFYVPQDLKEPVEVLADHYFFLGDNTLDSADGRDWKAVRFAWSDAEGDHKARGNYRARGENPAFGHDDEGVAYYGFRDEWGNYAWFPKSEGEQLGLPAPAPLVPRNLIQGRALAVFWPIKPTQGVWRLGWLR